MAVIWLMSTLAFLGIGWYGVLSAADAGSRPKLDFGSVFKNPWFYLQICSSLILGYLLSLGFLKVLRRNTEWIVNAAIYWGWLILGLLGVAFLVLAKPLMNSETS